MNQKNPAANAAPKPAPLDPAQVTASALADAVEFAKAHGIKSKIAVELERLTGRPVSRQMVEKWLHADPAKRREPLLGAGLALIALCDLLKNGHDGFADRAHKDGLVTIVQVRQPKTKTKKP